MHTSPQPTTGEPSGEQILFVMLAACLVLVATIASATLLPAAIGVSVAGAVLLAALAAVGGVVRTLLREPA